MRRAAAALVLLIVLAYTAAALTLTAGAHRLDPSSDGRRHTCGFITSEGVTEYLDAYEQRCGGGQ